MTFHVTKATSMDAFLVPQPTDSDADADSHATEPTDSDATEHAAERDEDDDATDRDEDGDATENTENGAATEHARGDLSAVTPEPPTKKQRTRSTVVSEEQPGDATEHADYSEDDCDEALPPVMTSIDAATTVADARGSKCSQRAGRIEMTGCIVGSCFEIWITTTIHVILKE